MGEDISPTMISGIYKQNGTTQDKLNVITYRKQGYPQNAQQGQGWQETNINDTLNVFDSGETRTPTLVLENHPQDSRLKIKEDGIFQTMGARGGMEYEPHTLMVLEPILLESNQNHATVQTDGISTTLPASMGMGGGYVPMVTEKIMDAIVRRLTPLECERLQGYPDGWTDIGEWVDSKGKTHKDSDSPRYKALGNSIALPFWEWMAERMLKELGKEHPTMASLFDGISGFCLCYARHGTTPVWSSEIEEFPIAVAKRHFGDDEKGIKGDYEQYL